MVDDGARKLAATQICPGFCGRVTSQWSPGNISYSSCQACSWGYRSIDKFLCTACEEPLLLYDWLYLTFIAVIPLLMHNFFIYFYSKYSNRLYQVSQYLCCFAECFISAVVSVLIMPPQGSFKLYGCSKTHLREWYPIFYNPVINHSHALRCTNEIVFPLYSLPFIYFAMVLVSLLILRSCLYLTLLRGTRVSSRPYYAALYAIPLISLCHSLLAGILYFIFPYVALLFSLGLNALHMALELNKTIRRMCLEMITKPHNISILIVHMALFGFSLFSLLSSRPISTDMVSIAVTVIILVPLPSIFYIFTVGITFPVYVHSSS
ncbi:unnamed protein product [Dracunculus medinensis]|uniref:JNK1/MAPK8-associated membrane protein n=1 Tax=Dracunculus medinensis TaxID=318479 RepID=A0A0N4UM26_DRAME|nr:unnamed protein product [Dracunculus medinensis]